MPENLAMDELDISGREAAEFVVGDSSSPLRERKIEKVLDLLRADYERSMRALDALIELTSDADARDLNAEEVEKWAKDAGHLLSADVRRCLSNLNLDKHAATLVSWYRYRPTEFDQQSFYFRDVLRWLSEKRASLAHLISAEVEVKAIEVQEAAAARPTWTVKTPKRYRQYIRPLCEFLKSEQIAGKPCPTAQDVMDAWKRKPPIGLNVTDKHVEYYTLNRICLADRKAIGQAIRNHVVYLSNNRS